jgi:hypothetical protein
VTRERALPSSRVAFQRSTDVLDAAPHGSSDMLGVDPDPVIADLELELSLAAAHDDRVLADLAVTSAALPASSDAGAKTSEAA